MSHLKRSAATGHLLKNAAGHLVNECASTTTTLGATTTTTCGPGCPAESYCSGHCPSTVYADIDINCEGHCDGTWQWDYSSGCEWTLTTDGDGAKGCTGGCSLQCVGIGGTEYWTTCIGCCPVSGPDVLYRKAAYTCSCPTGTYSAYYDSCCTNPPDINVYS